MSSSQKPAQARAPRLGRWARGLVGLLVLLAGLEALGRSGVVDRSYLPPSSEILARAARQLSESDFLTAVGATMGAWALGLLIAVGIGVPLGVLLGSVPGVNAAAGAIVEFLRPIPSVALIPLAVLMFGNGRPSTLLLVLYATFWQILVQVLYGVQDVDPVARDTARSYRFRFFTEGLQVVWPTTLPYAMTGFRLGAAVALILTITGELIIGTPGLGKLLALAQQSGQVASMYALVFVTGILGVIVNLGARAVERRFLHWHPSIRRESAA